MEFRIPDRFELGGIDITVEKLQVIPNSDFLGQCSIAEGLIQIAEEATGIKQCETAKLQTFFHELVHGILDTMEERELSKNEKFVNTFSSFLTGAIRSME